MPCLTTAFVSHTQTITGLSSTQAATLSFRRALVKTVASMLAVPASTVSIWKVACCIGPRGSTKVAYSTSVRSSMNATVVTSALNKAVLKPVFASNLSAFCGIPVLSVTGNFTVTVSSAAIVAAPTAPTGIPWRLYCIGAGALDWLIRQCYYE